MAVSAKIENKWLESVSRNPKAELRLFCFPYAGGSASIFASWSRALPNFVHVVPVQLPGRGNRIAEAPWRKIDQLADAIAQDLLPIFKEKPFAFFGHSMGATLSFEVTRRLAGRREVMPESLLISGRRAPHIPDDEAPTYDLPEEEFIHELKRLKGTPKEVIECAELMELITPVLRADFEAIQTYQYSPAPPLECPFVVMGGMEDIEVPREFLEGWRMHTSTPCPVTMFPGDHFFLHSQKDMVLKFIAQTLTQLWQLRSTRNRVPVQ
jgi:medium-chain acyl-[acyl-carrier-protein] hydrolase